MKLSILLLVAVAIHAAPIFTCTGACTPIASGFALDLLNLPGTAHDQTATLLSSEPLQSVTFFADNYPNAVGSGFVVKLDGQLALNTGIGVPVQQVITLSSQSLFQRIEFSTNEMLGWREHGLVLRISGDAPGSSVPEPGGWALMGLGLASIVGWRRK